MVRPSPRVKKATRYGRTANDDGRPWSGELNDIQERAGDYTEAQRLRDREEEMLIKGRASRVSLSHV